MRRAGPAASEEAAEAFLSWPLLGVLTSLSNMEIGVAAAEYTTLLERSPVPVSRVFMAKRSTPRRSTSAPARARTTGPQRAGAAPARRPAPASDPAAPKGQRKFRGAAPWATRHAAKHAAEAAARNREPPRPGSARATLRTPERAEGLKAQIGELHALLTELKALKQKLHLRFYAAGQLLKKIRDDRLYEAKGYSSFEAFVEREVDLGSRALALKLARIPDIFLPAAADEIGLEGLLACLTALDQAQATRTRTHTPPRRGSR